MAVTTDYLIDLNEMEMPSILRVDHNLYAATFVLMKLIVARCILRRAEQEGLLRRGGHVFESTSGTMGLGLAYACRESGYRLTLISDPVIDEGLRLKLEALGAKVVIVDTPLANGGFQGARLKMLKKLRSQVPQSYWTRQYDNVHAVLAYYSAAKRIADSVGCVNFLVASVATGGSATGLIRGLREVGQNVRLIAVDTHSSVLFGQPDGTRLLRGLGNSIVPKNLDYSLVKQCHWVSAAEAFQMTAKLFRDHLLDVGPTSGATYLVARWIAEQNPNQNVVFVCADTGERYRETVYNPGWLASNGLLGPIPHRPRLVKYPDNAGTSWAYMQWNSRQLSDLTTTSELRAQPPRTRVDSISLPDSLRQTQAQGLKRFRT